MRDMVLILNFSESSSRDIARSLRAEQVCCKIVPASITLEEVEAQCPRGVILSGSVSGRTLSGLDSRIVQGSLPVLALGLLALSALWLLNHPPALLGMFCLVAGLLQGLVLRLILERICS